MYFQLASLLGAAVGWLDGAPGRGDLRLAIAAVPISAVMGYLSWIEYSQAAIIYAPLSGFALGYAVGFIVHRAPKE